MVRGTAPEVLEALTALEALPSLLGMSPAEVRAAQVLGVVLDAADTVALAGSWLGADLYTPALCDLAASDWDAPDLDRLWDRALDELGVTTPTVTSARRVVRDALERRRRPAPVTRCTCSATRTAPETAGELAIPAAIPRPRVPRRVVPA